MTYKCPTLKATRCRLTGCAGRRQSGQLIMAVGAVAWLIGIQAARGQGAAAAAISRPELRMAGTLRGPAGTAVLFSPDGKVLATAGRDQAQLWDTTNLHALHAPFAHGATIERILFTPDGKLLLTVGGPQVRLWNTQGGQLQRGRRYHRVPRVTAKCRDARSAGSGVWSDLAQGLACPLRGMSVH